MDEKTETIGEILDNVYATRNLADGRWDAGQVYARLDDAEERASRLADGPEKTEYCRRIFYNRAMVYREVYAPNHFMAAAMVHVEVATWPELSPGKRFSAEIFAAVERAHHGLEIRDRGLIDLQYQAIRQAMAKADAEVTADKEAVKVLLADATGHCAEIAFMGKFDYPERADDLATLALLPEPIATTYKVWPVIYAGMEQLVGGDFNGAMLAAEHALRLNFHPYSNAMAKLVMARARQEQNMVGEASALFQSIIYQPGHGAHMVRAAARLELATLTG